MKIFNEMTISGRVRITAYRAGTKEILRRTAWYPNLVVTSWSCGRNLVAQRLTGNNWYTLNITHGDIGTGQATPQNWDIRLTTPVARGAVTSAIANNNVALLQFFFTDAALPNGTYYEFGTFVDGTGTLSSGRLFNHALFGTPYVKGTGEDTTVEVDFTIN